MRTITTATEPAHNPWLVDEREIIAKAVYDAVGQRLDEKLAHWNNRFAKSLDTKVKHQDALAAAVFEEVKALLEAHHRQQEQALQTLWDRRAQELQDRHEQQLADAQAAHERMLGEVKDLLTHLHVTVAVPPPRPTQKLVSYDEHGRPASIVEQPLPAEG